MCFGINPGGFYSKSKYFGIAKNIINPGEKILENITLRPHAVNCLGSCRNFKGIGII